MPESDLLPVSLEDFKKQLTDNDTADFGVDDDDELTRHLLAATGLIEDRVGPLVTRPFVEDHRMRRHRGGSGYHGRILLRRRPAVAVTALSSIIYGVITSIDDFDPDAHYLDAESGIFDLLGYGTGWSYRVTYTAGRGVQANIPAKFVQAVLITAEHLWETQRGRGLHPSRFGSQTDPTEVPEIMRGFALPRRAQELIGLEEQVVFG